MKHLFLLLCATMPLWASAQVTYHIKGDLPNWKANHQDSIYLDYFKGDKQIIDSVAVVNGHFELNGTIDQPYEAMIWSQPLPLKSPRDLVKLYLENSNITIVTKDSLRQATVKAGPVNKDYRTVQALNRPILDRLTSLRITAMKTSKEEQKTESFKTLEKEYYGLVDSLFNVRKQFMLVHPKSFLSLATLAGSMPPAFSYAKYAPLYNGLDAAVRNTPLGKEIGARLEKGKHIDIGSVMPDFKSLDTARQELNLTKVIRSGKITLVDFWASWCRPCRAENPNVVKAFNAFHDKGFNIISVSLDDNASSWKAAIVKDGMPWFHVSGLKKWDEPVAQLFGIDAVPDNFLLDASGKVIARNLKGEALYKTIESKLD